MPKHERIEWPEPADDPKEEPVDRHRGPLDRDEDGRWLDRDDPRRVEAEKRLGHRFSDEEDN
jgi:hypothetical protein